MANEFLLWPPFFLFSCNTHFSPPLFSNPLRRSDQNRTEQKDLHLPEAKWMHFSFLMVAFFFFFPFSFFLSSQTKPDPNPEMQLVPPRLSPSSPLDLWVLLKLSGSPRKLVPRPGLVQLD